MKAASCNQIKGETERLRAQEAGRALLGVKWRGSGVLDVSIEKVVLGLENREERQKGMQSLSRSRVCT